MQRAAIVVVFGLLAGLYLFDLGHTPVYFGGDEAHFAVVGHSLATTGRNLNGDFLPLYISLADPADASPLMPWGNTWYQPLLFYIVAAFLTVLPLSEISVRLPTALIGGIGIPVLTYLVANRLFANRRLAIASAVLIALAPPQVILSRQALDYICPLPFVLGWLWFLLDYTRTKRIRSAALGGLMLGLGFYSYIASWVMMPLYLGLSWLMYAGVQGRFGFVRPSLAAAGGFLLPILLAVPWLWAHPDMLRETFNRYRISDRQHVSVLQDPRNALSLDKVRATISAYWDYFDPAYLFLVGGPSLTTSTGRVGVFLLPFALLLPVGMWALLRRAEPVGLLLIAGFVTAPLAATVMGESYAVQRVLFILPFAAIIATYGLVWLWESRVRLARALAIGALALLPLQFGVFYWDYFTHYKLRSAFYYDAVAFADVADYLMADRTAPAIYMYTELDDGGVKWRFHLTKHGRTDLLARTKYFASDGMDVVGVAPGSLMVVYPKNLELAALEATRQWKVEKVVHDVDRRPAAAILRRVD